MPEPPIGSIIAFGGSGITRAWEQNGWLLCDGRLLDKYEPGYLDLFLAIGFAWGGDGDRKFNLPDLQGFFLRGVDAFRSASQTPDARVPFPVDPDHDERFPSRPGGNGGQSVGSVQLSATARPRGREPFGTTPNGDHDHTMDFEPTASRDVGDQFNTIAQPNIGGYRPKTAWSGLHSHGIGGWNQKRFPVSIVSAKASSRDA